MGEISGAYIITDHFLPFVRVFLSQNQKIHQWGVGTMRLGRQNYADETPTVGRTFPGFFRQHNKLRGNPEKRKTFFNTRDSIDMSFQVVTTLEGNIYSSDIQKRSSWFSETKEGYMEQKSGFNHWAFRFGILKSEDTVVYLWKLQRLIFVC